MKPFVNQLGFQGSDHLRELQFFAQEVHLAEFIILYI